jgi:peroxiredoxin
MTIQEGKTAPTFTLPDADGNWHRVAKAADHPSKVLGEIGGSNG